MGLVNTITLLGVRRARVKEGFGVRGGNFERRTTERTHTLFHTSLCIQYRAV